MHILPILSFPKIKGIILRTTLTVITVEITTVVTIKVEMGNSTISTRIINCLDWDSKCSMWRIRGKNKFFLP